MELELDLNDLKDSAVRRLLMKAVRNELNRSKPLHKRAKEDEEIEDDDATEEADEERESLAALSEEKRGKAAPIPMDDEDLSEESMEKLEPPKKGKKK